MDNTTTYGEPRRLPPERGVRLMFTYNTAMLVLATVSTVATVIGVIIAILKK